MSTIEITRPDDWHLHLRDGAVMEAVTPESAHHFARAIIMPNLVPPVVTKADAEAYRDRIRACIPPGADFTPLMTLYLTESTDAADVAEAFNSNTALAVKLYPAGATTNSHSGVRNLDNVMGVLETMAKIGMTLCMHGEVTSSDVDIFDREKVFIETVLDPLRNRLPELRITMEHITTKDSVEYVRGSEKNLAASITPHHLMINRNAILAGGIRPHYYCLPVAKRELHRLALRKAATSGDPRFFLGTDSAPHVDPMKECGCGCAGLFTASNAIACLAQIFEDEGALDKLSGFTSHNGSIWYGLDINKGTLTLTRSEKAVSFPTRIQTRDGNITVFDPQTSVYWTAI
ncbi:dihydroorotase [Pseudohoeflea suaedae]|uniref:Dihydroorotase n=1 Tax=Pseudohoeflea suaedae TaxID=877384 RepID=A0A4R5PKA2_9HYPH|nr:dihydroorotase [Pseudohoeflea suaedae]TDH35250.1 dihydroorotase [Pseudohoeflea suaedae]